MPKRVKQSLGSCRFEQISPQREALEPTTRVLNVLISFEDALKLHVAIQNCVLRLNGYDRSTVDGRRAAMNLAVFLDQKAITITEGNLPR